MTTGEFLPDSESRFSVDVKGAYLTQLHDAAGQPILFGKTEIDGKTRGGCHVCLPNFGPDTSGELAQHGFGRTAQWELLRNDEDVKELGLPFIDGPYAGLSATLRYQYGSPDDPHLTMRLAVYNDADDGVPLRVAPAFHPYFAVPEGQEVRFNGQLLNLSEYAGTKYVEGTTHELQVGDRGRTLTLHSDELTVWALWTDQKGEYFCVEPSMMGQSFQSAEPAAEELLRRGELRTYDFSIYWA